MSETNGAKGNTNKNIIDNTVKEAIAVVAAAAREAVQLVASDARDATKLLASNAADAAKIANLKGDEDHDLLIELRTEMKGVRTDIKEYKSEKADKHDVDELKTAVYDKLEVRFRKIENKVSNYLITISVAGIVMMSMITLIIWHILHTS